MESRQRVLLIGAGNIGRRHLQGLLLSRMSFDIHVVDPFESSLEAARQMIKESSEHSHTISFHTSYSNLPKQANIAIIATAADIRLRVLEELLNSCSLAYVILEKVLFQKLSDYEQAKSLLAKSNTIAYVNCPRRYFPHYQKLHAEAFSRDWKMTVTGSNWGLACNAVHFIDLYNYLTGEIPEAYNTTALLPEIVASKRAGFVEVNGSLKSKDARLEINCLLEEGHPIEVNLVRADEQILIQEGKGLVEGFSANYEAIPLSQMAHLPVQELLVNGTCGLTPYALSASLHQPFIQALLEFATGKINIENGLPIT